MQIDQTLRNNETDSAPADLSSPIRCRLTELPPGSYARMLDFSPEIPSDRRAQLQAYGVIPGNALWLRQHKPVTVIQVDHTELAFESNISNAIFVEEV